MVLFSVLRSTELEIPKYHYEELREWYGPLVWNFGPHKKIISFTLPFVAGKSVEVHPVNNRNKPIRFDPDNPFDWNKFWKLKIKQIRWKD